MMMNVPCVRSSIINTGNKHQQESRVVSSYLSVSSAVARLSTLLALSISARILFSAAMQSGWNGIRELSVVVLSNFIPLSIRRYSTSSVVRVRSLMEWPTSSSQDDWPSIWKVKISDHHYLPCDLTVALTTYVQLSTIVTSTGMLQHLTNHRIISIII